MLITLPSGLAVDAPTTPTSWTDQAPSVLGGAVTSSLLEWNVTAGVQFHRRRPLFQGVARSAQTIAQSTWTAIALGEIIDTPGGHNDDSNSALVTVGEENHWYFATGYVPFSAASGQNAIAGIRRYNSSTEAWTIFEGAKMPLGSGHAMTPMVVDLVQIGIPPYRGVELMGYHRVSGGLDTVVAGKAPSLTLRWACAASGTVAPLPSVPRTWTADDLLTGDSADAGEVPLNVHLRDVLDFLRYPPVCRVDSAGTSQTLPSGAWTSINMPTETIDNYGGHSTSSNTSRYTVQRAGLYYVYGLAAVTDPGSPTGFRASRLLVNGTTAYAGTSCHPDPSSVLGTAVPVCAHLRLAAGDYVELQMFHTQGSAISVKTGAGDASRLIAVWRGL